MYIIRLFKVLKYSFHLWLLINNTHIIYKYDSLKYIAKNKVILHNWE